MVGMSKNGSRYGRRSNWFKIHCLLQEQQQQAAAAAAAQGNKNTPPPSTLSMLGHPSYPHSMYARPPCTKEELMLLGFEDYKHPSASPSVSSPDSHNSDSSVEVGDRRNSLLRQQMPNGRDTMPPFNKELFLPLGFPGLPMPPPGFLPPSHLMFPGYHPALYAQHQGLLKPVMDTSSMHNGGGGGGSDGSPSLVVNNNNRFVPNHNIKTEEEAKRYFLDAVLKSQRSQINVPIKCDEKDDVSLKCEVKDDDTEEDLEVSMTPPRSPAALSAAASLSANPQRISLPFMRSVTSESVLSVSAILAQDIPIDLSMKTNSSCTSEGRRTMSPGGESDLSDDIGHHHMDKKSRHSSCSEPDDDFDHTEGKRKKIDGGTSITATTTPLDLSTKVECSVHDSSDRTIAHSKYI